MKKLYITGLLVIASISAFAQGTVNFNNNTLAAGAGLVYLGNPASGGTPLVGTNYVAQLYAGAAGATESSLTAVGAVGKFRVSTTTSPGTWSGGTRTLGIASGDAALQVRVWDVTKAPDYATAFAQANGLFTGKSSVFAYSIPAAGAPPDAFFMKNFSGVIVAVPEPSTILFGLLGASALLFRRRK